MYPSPIHNTRTVQCIAHRVTYAIYCVLYDTWTFENNFMAATLTNENTGAKEKH